MKISHFPKPVATRRSDQPVPGFYILRLVKNGPWVGGQVRRDGEEWSAMIDGVWDGPSRNPWTLEKLVRLHHFGQFSTESEVKFRIGQRRWAEVYSPNHDAANPRRPIDLDKHIPF